MVERHVRNDPEPDEKKSGAARKNRRDFLLFPDAGAGSSGQGRECSQTAYELHGSTGAKGNEGLSGAWHPDRRGQCQNADEEPAGHPCGVYQRERSALEVQVGSAE